MTITEQQPLFESIKANRNDNHKLWALTGEISKSFAALNKTIATQLKQLEQLKSAQGMNGESKRIPLPDDASDSEVRTRARLLLMDKLNDGSITASEFSQFKDVFNLASATDDLSITVIQYDNMIIECPGCGLNLHEPSNEPTDALTEG